MQSFTIIMSVVLAGLVTFAQPKAFPHYNKPTTWVGPNGHKLTLYGDAAELTTQLMALDPGYVPGGPPPAVVARSPSASTYGPFPGFLCCPVNTFVPVLWADASNAVNATYALGKQACVSFPGSCGLVNAEQSCQDGAGVYVCNDSPNYIVRDCKMFAEMGGDIIDQCKPLGQPTGCGQDFPSGEFYNIVIDSC